MPEHQPVTWRFLILTFALLFATMIALYAESFLMRPAGDDFAAPLTEIQRGKHEGPAAFFKMSAQSQNYRPLQSTVMWLFGSISEEHRLTWLRIMGFTCMAMYAIAGLLWMRRMPIGRAGVLAAAAVFFLHPVLVGAVGGVDGFGGPMAVAFMWLGALAVLAFRDRMAVALPLVAICFIIGGITKEYAFGLGPLAIWTALVFSHKHRWRNAFLVGVTLVAVLAGLMYIRQYTIPPGLEAGLAYVSRSPLSWIKNIALLATSLVFMGNTAWVMLRADVIAFGFVALVSLIMIAILLGGMVSGWRHEAARQSSTGDPVQSQRHWMVYLIFALGAAGAAPLLTERASEMYTVGLVLPFAMLVGLAMDGWSRRTGLAHLLAWAGLLALLALAAISLPARVSMLRETGEQADAKLRAILAALPSDASDRHLAIICDESHIVSQPRYSIFVMNDLQQIEQPKALQWLEPDRNLTLEVLLLGEGEDWQSLDLERFDHVLYWRHESQQYELLR